MVNRIDDFIEICSSYPFLLIKIYIILINSKTKKKNEKLKNLFTFAHNSRESALAVGSSSCYQKHCFINKISGVRLGQRLSSSSSL